MDPEKKEKLEGAGYVLDEDLMCYVSRKDGRIFSSAWVEVNNPNTLQATLATPHSPTAWQIYLNPDQPHQEIRTALLEKYGSTP